MSIGFIGLGVMGEPMCRNLCIKLQGNPQVSTAAQPSDDLFSICVYDVQADKTTEFKKLGARVCGSVGQLAENSNYILLSLPGGKELKQVLAENGGVFDHAAEGTVIVDFSTSPVALTRELAAIAIERGLHYVDSPVARTRKAAESGTLAMSVGGETSDVERVKPLLECMATDITHVGGVGNGQLVKILNNLVLFQTVNALAEAQELASRAGMDAASLFGALEQGSANSFALHQHGMHAMLPDLYPENAFSVAYAKKDLSYALELADATGTRVEGAQHIDNLFQRAIKNGMGEQYWPVIRTLLATD